MRQKIYFPKAIIYLKFWLVIILMVSGFVSGQMYVQKGASVYLKGNAVITVSDTAKASKEKSKTSITQSTRTARLKYISDTEIDYYPETVSRTDNHSRKAKPKISLEPEKVKKTAVPPPQKKEADPNYTQNTDSQKSASAGNSCRFAVGLQDHHQKNSAETPQVLQKIFFILPETSIFAYGTLPAQYVSGRSLFIRPPPAVFSI
ncbi:hypothetical protein [Daejeonia sp. YH14]|uniref:hypothetical protein n=1 Tax=Daejeonia sp. YH14 TaxID=3439042 RepID=UPI003F49495D